MLLEVDPELDIPPGELDGRLARGWFRAGPMYVRSPIVFLGGEIRPTLQVRVNLERQAQSRSRRRSLRRNRTRFRLVEGPARVDAERERLYEAMKPRFAGFVSPTLAPIVFDEEHPESGRSRELAVYDGERLVAVSYFDRGHHAVAGLLGLHDPDYARYGLGRYTMLEEIERARADGARFYYPGYAIPGVAGFDYKLALGGVETLRSDGRWRPFTRMPRASPLVARIQERSAELEAALRARGVPCEPRLYPLLWLASLDLCLRYVESPVHLRCETGSEEHSRLIAEYLPRDDTFSLARVEADALLDAGGDLDPRSEVLDTKRYETRALVYTERICRSRSAEPVAEAAATARSSRGGPRGVRCASG